ncbi:MAG: sulfotransferase family protein [Desulfobacterales bacterium]|nr:sulfotransferase family protein [Desulfobacterales bacterium]
MPSCRRYNISICNDKKFIWFRVAKVGTRSVFKIFNQVNLTLDAEHPWYCHYPVQQYQTFFKFGFIRNPWDRLVSCWQNKVVKKNHFEFSESQRSELLDFKKFVDYVSGLDIENCDCHLRLQSKLIDLNNIDYIGRFETFEKDLSYILNRINIDPIAIPHENKSKSRDDYQSYYTRALKDQVAQIYQKDIMLFSYRF